MLWLKIQLFGLVINMYLKCKVLMTVLGLVLGSSAFKKNESGQLYFVNSAKCQMPYINPFTSEILAAMNINEFENCTDDKDLISSQYDFDLRRYRLDIHANLTKAYLNSTGHKTITCSYREIKRDTKARVPDNTYIESKKYHLAPHTIVPINTEFMITKCYMRNRTTVLRKVQEDAFSFVQDKLTPERIKRYAKERERKPSVLIMGLDSVSRINFRRTMPNMFKFVNEQGWHEMQGFNKVGDNTFPNLLPALTGYSEEGSLALCNVSEVNCLDRLPFIWKNYKRANYLTAYAEDCRDLSTFNYLKPGFVQQPTDYYLRHFLTALEDKFSLRKRFGNVYCVGRDLSFNYVFDFGLQFVQRFINETPIFGFLWSNSFTHDYFDAPTALDDHFLDYMKKFKAAGLFESSIVVLMSDHGHRYNTLRRARSGYLEERLPMMFIYVPPWFRKKYPHLVANLAGNRNRLSSNFDFYMTLRHLLQLDSKSMAEINPKPPQCSTCQSLLFEVPFNRSCREAGIEEHWCSCQPSETITKASYARRIALAVVRDMNKQLRLQKLTNLCHDFMLKHLHKLDRKQILATDEGPSNANESYYIVNFKTRPNSAHFETTVRYNNLTGAIQMNINAISRLNSYAKDAKCLEQKVAKKYCICKDSVRKKKRQHLNRTYRVD